MFSEYANVERSDSATALASEHDDVIHEFPEVPNLNNYQLTRDKSSQNSLD